MATVVVAHSRPRQASGRPLRQRVTEKMRWRHGWNDVRQQKLALIRETAFVLSSLKDFLLKELFPEPDRHGHIERFEAAGALATCFKGEIELQNGFS